MAEVFFSGVQYAALPLVKPQAGWYVYLPLTARSSSRFAIVTLFTWFLLVLWFLGNKLPGPVLDHILIFISELEIVRVRG